MLAIPCWLLPIGYSLLAIPIGCSLLPIKKWVQNRTHETSLAMWGPRYKQTLSRDFKWD